jgi:hypothetical protein
MVVEVVVIVVIVVIVLVDLVVWKMRTLAQTTETEQKGIRILVDVSRVSLIY